MSKTIEFLSSLNKGELAFFHRYRLKTFTKSTQDKILRFYEKINLTEDQIDNLVQTEFKPNSNRDFRNCPRCNSKKIGIEKTQSDETGPHGGILDLIPVATDNVNEPEMIENAVCYVCGYWVKNSEREKGYSLWANFIDFITAIYR